MFLYFVGRERLRNETFPPFMMGAIPTHGGKVYNRSRPTSRATIHEDEKAAQAGGFSLYNRMFG
jgi:hypothetical protein